MATRSSCEPMRTSAYSEDIRWRMVWQREVQGLTLERVACNLSVDVSTVHRIVKKFEETGSVSKKKYSIVNRQQLQKLTKPVQLTVLHLVLQRPSIYLWELQQELYSMFGLEVSVASLCNFLKKSNFSRKKMQLVALQMDQGLRTQFVTDVLLYNADTLIFIDETGCDRRNTIRKHGYGVRGKPVRCPKLLVRGERISVIVAMTVNGILDLQIVRGSVNGDIFMDFIQRVLLPNLMPFNGTNPNSVVLLDNCSVHHVEGVVDTIQEMGTIVHFLPPYSPDLTPIELLFSKVKGLIQAMEMEMISLNDIDTIVLAAFSCITSDDCRSWISSIGIYD